MGGQTIAVGGLLAAGLLLASADYTISVHGLDWITHDELVRQSEDPLEDSFLGVLDESPVEREQNRRRVQRRRPNPASGHRHCRSAEPWNDLCNYSDE